MCCAGIPSLDITAPGFSTRSEEVRAARERHWCAKTPLGYAVLRHREVGLLLRDRRLRQGSHNWPRVHGLEGSFAEFWQRSIISTEGPEHRALRGHAVAALRPDDIAALRPAFDEIADDLADRIVAKGDVEFMAGFALPFAGQAICALLHLPREDWPGIASDAADLGLAMGLNCKAHEPVFNAACERLTGVADRLIDRVAKGDDRESYVARLASGFDPSDPAQRQTLRDLVVISIFGGVDTTRAQLGFAIDLFIAHPDQWDRLREAPDLIPAAVEEIIRTRPTTTWATREAVEDFEFGGVSLRRGDLLHMFVHASASDPAINGDDRFDVTARRKMHFGFGGGAHHCLGALVARSDMAAALGALVARIERFTYWAAPQFLPDSGNTSPISLPVKIHCGDDSNARPDAPVAQ